MSRQAVLVRKCEGRKRRDALLAAEFIALLGLELGGATPIGRLVRKPVKLVLKRCKNVEALMDKLEGLKTRANDLLTVLLRADDEDGFAVSMDPIILQLADFIEDASSVLKWTEIRRFVCERDLERVVRRAKITLGNVERRYELGREELKSYMQRKFAERQELILSYLSHMTDL